MNHIHQVIYINLEHRTDRRFYAEAQLRSYPFPRIERLVGIPCEDGVLGCTLSHLCALEQCDQDHEDERYFIILGLNASGCVGKYDIIL